jgi:hypothetical protein
MPVLVFKANPLSMTATRIGDQNPDVGGMFL